MAWGRRKTIPGPRFALKAGGDGADSCPRSACVPGERAREPVCVLADASGGSAAESALPFLQSLVLLVCRLNASKCNLWTGVANTFSYFSFQGVGGSLGEPCPLEPCPPLTARLLLDRAAACTALVHFDRTPRVGLSPLHGSRLSGGRITCE